ncbi:PIG-L deacetylase family protein [Leucobacter denitrificans]|uniref:PIG-L family deacetylase n=1 Tax=Leucobacter denitrificans TaxID=683042 RepID=A0A7G9S510_9MICO|nr:PIG-L deacetylase family protein [Leucobacter denitrificans]QNN62935.1 PIG-L family deacetylase [Leucobacter denitrificans]
MTTLELFDATGIERVLCVVAHPDDMEYGGSAVAAEWSARGIEVSYLLLTAGEAGIRTMTPSETAPCRADEQRKACEIVGVESLTILDLPDGLVEPSVGTRRRIAREIRSTRPDAVVTMSWGLEAPWGLNHVDHRSTGIAVIDAIRDADNPWLFREQLTDEGLEAWKAEWLLVMMHQPTHAIEVSEDAAERAVRSLEAHEVYLAAIPNYPVPRELVTGVLSDGGERAGVPFALPIRPYRM